MKLIKSVVAIGAGIACYYLVFPRPAYAYLDPGTGSYIFQILIAAFVGGAFAIKIFWKRITQFCKRIFGKNGLNEDDDS